MAGGGVDLAVVEPGALGNAELRALCAHPAWQTAGLLLVCRRGGPAERAQALEAGAVNVVAPYDMAELLARIRARLRERARAAVPEHLRLTPERWLDREGQRLLSPTEAWPLCSREFRLLLVFQEHAGMVLSRRQLARAAWGPEHEDDVREVDRYVAMLRGKLGESGSHPAYLLTHRQEGYSFRRG